MAFEFNKKHLLAGLVAVGVMQTCILREKQEASRGTQPVAAAPAAVACKESACLDHRAIGWIDRSKKAVQVKLKDPQSAQFQSVEFFPARPSAPPMVCGEVNAKNSFGGMAGFSRFISAGSVELTYLETEVSDFPVLWAKFCG